MTVTNISQMFTTTRFYFKKMNNAIGPRLTNFLLLPFSYQEKTAFLITSKFKSR